MARIWKHLNKGESILGLRAANEEFALKHAISLVNRALYFAHFRDHHCCWNLTEIRAPYYRASVAAASPSEYTRNFQVSAGPRHRRPQPAPSGWGLSLPRLVPGVSRLYMASDKGAWNPLGVALLGVSSLVCTLHVCTLALRHLNPSRSPENHCAF